MKIKINNQEYEASPLRCKHLKQLTKHLQEPKRSAGYSELERFIPMMGECIRYNHPEFKNEELEELTLNELLDAWNGLIQESGIKIVNSGEARPTAPLSGQTSTPESPAPSSTPIQ